MKTENKLTALILGGAGFIGSNLAECFLNAHYHVIVVDGLLEQTGGARKNLDSIISHIQFFDSKIEDIENLSDLIAQSDIVVDSMAWMPHLLAINDPRYDLRLNVESHLYFIDHLIGNSEKKIIYLASRSQYGNPNVEKIYEDTPMDPVDIHGIHKLTSESYYKVYSRVKNINVISLRIPNCFGENQLVKGEDLGLVGNFVRDIMNDGDIEIYGVSRRRSLVYVRDLADVVLSLSMKEFEGFSAFNIRGHEIMVEDLVKILIEIIGKGKYRIYEPPNEIKTIDMGSKRFMDEKIKRYIGDFSLTDLGVSLENTVKYFVHSLN